ncbi:MAG: ABC-type transport auxiliary lipoprotein family protein [Rhodospirillales bacterium]|jgi:ABC-type uncharacterized transport system auxiliary subunit|nr:ABC-type transport auxiliary lipoprotein family protein [Rhodospirillales bacterium]
MRAARHLAWVLALVLMGCAQPPLPQDHFYRLAVAEPDQRLQNPHLNGTIEVVRFLADGLTAGRPIVYSNSGEPNALFEYHYHFWVEAPTLLLRDALVVYLRAAGVAKAVVTPELRVDPDFVLAGKIHRLERVVGAEPSTVVALELSLRETGTDRLLFLKTYRLQLATADDSVAGAATAINQALSRIFADFTADLSAI